MKVLMVNHAQERCGVYQHGKRLFDVLSSDKRYESSVLETDSVSEFYTVCENFKPDYIFYNWHESTIPWLTPEVSHTVQSKQILFHHENGLPHHLDPDAIIMADMTEDAGLHQYSLSRVLLDYDYKENNNDVVTIGSFGFGFNNKGFGRIISKVCEEFDEAVVNMHITSAFFGDESGALARQISESCRSFLSNPGVTLNITNNFISDEEVLHFLALNDINIFLYDNMTHRGLSSAIDYAISCGRPFAINSSYMFRHLRDVYPEINLDNNSIKDVLSLGNYPSMQLKELWSNENIRNKFYDILGAI